MAHIFVPDPADHDAVPPDRMERMNAHFEIDQGLFVGLLGIVIEEVRVGYCRLRLPFDEKLTQAAGQVHGGAIATLIDMAAVPAVYSHFDGAGPTIDLHVQYVGSAAGTDLTAVGWTTRVGRSIAYARAVVLRGDGAPVAIGQHTFKIA